jgi:DNA-binding NarL/FixJ family response regulator
LKMRKIKVILSYPQVIFREGIHFILSGEEDFEVIGEATDNREAFELIELNPPDIAILGQKDDKISGTAMTRRIKQVYPLVSVILIAGGEDTGHEFGALLSGVSAVITQDSGPEDLVTVIKDVARGRLPVVELLLVPTLAARALVDFQDLATLSGRLGIPVAQPTKKETEILGSIASGSAIGQVAAGLNLKEETVRDRLRIILYKLTANDRTRAVIEQARLTLPMFISAPLTAGAGPQGYLTKDEFEEFKESLTARFRSLIGEKS